MPWSYRAGRQGKITGDHHPPWSASRRACSHFLQHAWETFRSIRKIHCDQGGRFHHRRILGCRRLRTLSQRSSIPMSGSGPAAGDSRAEALKKFSGTAIVPAISQWEVAMLVMKGRLDLKPDAETWFTENLAAPVSLAPLTSDISLESCRLPDFHGDPAERLIVATAMVLGLPLITADEKIVRWKKRRKRIQVIAL